MIQQTLTPTKKKYISVFALTMLMSGAVDGIGNLPSIALFGPKLIFFFIAAAFIFLIPVGFISAELCHQYPEDSGVYAWSKQAFGGGFSALTIWLQWINTMIWFPTCLTTLVGTLAYLLNPSLAHNPYYLVLCSLSVFWGMTFINLKGIKQSTKIASLASSVGMLLPIFIIIGLCGLWVILGKATAIDLTQAKIIPSAHLQSWTSLTAIITAFLGLELATTHVKKIQHAKIKFPKALFMTIIIICITMGIGSLAVAVVIPHSEIVLVSGTIQAFNILFNGLHIKWATTVLTLLLVFGSLGTMINWLISPANGLAEAAKDHYLPTIFAQENKHGVPDKILLLQAVVVSISCCAFFLMPSINGSYWLLLDLSTEIYVIMYLLMFIAAFKLLYKADKIAVIAGGKIVCLTLCVLGAIGCMITLCVGFIPPASINTGSANHFVSYFSIGLLVMCAPALLLAYHHNKKSISQ